MGRWLVLAAVIPAACYRPSIEAPCTASCEAAGEAGACPGDQECGADLRCHGANDDECSLQPDASDQVCVGHAFVHVCFVPTVDVTPMAGTINTDTDTRCRPDIGADLPKACVIVGRNVIIANPVNVTGTRALVLAASDDLAVTSTLDAASHTGGLIGPSSTVPSVSCTKAINAVSGSAGSGGFGGSFQGQGGAGGAGAGTGGEMGGIPSAVVAVTSIDALSGPCASGIGSDGDTQTGGGGGAGGGAVALLAARITINGLVNVSGAGGSGGRPNNGGGGGGGAGGMVLLDADSIMVGGIVLANGGGGGGGAGNGTAGSGADASLSPPFIGAMGGVGSQLGGHGGEGGGSDLANGRLGLMSASNAGGGGGGGVGYILATSPIPSGMLSPAPTPISH